MQRAMRENQFKTAFMMSVFVAFIGVLGVAASALYQKPSMVVSSLVFGVCYALFSYFVGTKMSLAVNGAREVSETDEPRLYGIVKKLAAKDGLPMPKVYIMQDPALNAFATGRNHQNAVVCATSGILEALNDQELEGVMAHEMGHVKNYDIRVSMIAFALSAVVSVMADFILRMTWFRNSDEETPPIAYALGIVAALVAPFIGMLVQMAISRQREYLADATGAETTHMPKALASALRKISQHGSATQTQSTATAHLFFANPLRAKGVMNLFSTHPPIEERIQRLEEMHTHG